MTWRVLLANLTLGGHTGTEVVTRDLALGLAGRGHDVSVFTRASGPLGAQLLAAGIPVADRLEDIPAAPEIVHGHHYWETIDALCRFPQARGVFVCHDRTAPHSIPPRMDRIRRYVAVDLNCLERLRDEWGVPEAQTRVILNAVDTARFIARAPLPPAPTRALVFSHYASPATHVDVVRDACARLNIPMDVLGSEAGTAVTAPEARLGDYDLVFGKGRSALEAVAVGAAVVLCDAAGLGPMVTFASLPMLRAWNLGSRLLRDPLDAGAIVREIRKYDPTDAAAASGAVRAEASLSVALDQYEALYADVMADIPEFPPAGDVHALIEPLLRRVGALERDLAAYSRPDRMLALSDADVSALKVSLVSAPATVAPGDTAFVRVRLENGAAGQVLGTWPPCPLNWGYRWRAEDTAEFQAAADIRTPIRRAVPLGGADDFAVKTIAPGEPGRYVLRITLVQEGLRWLDETATPVCVDVPVEVK